MNLPKPFFKRPLARAWQIGLALVASILVACGGGGGGGTAATPSLIAPLLALFAGDLHGFGSVDGTGAAASFNYPYGIATDAYGNRFVVDTGNHTIRKITPTGVVSTFAGAAGQFGSADGTGATARFYYPQGIAIDSNGTLYVSDTNNHTIRKISLAGEVTTLAGTAGGNGGSMDAVNGLAASFLYPNGVAVNAMGTVYVADGSNHTIRQITAAGEVTTLAGSAGGNGGAVDDTGPLASFKYPSGLTLDGSGNLYVADYGNHTIRKITVTVAPGTGVVTAAVSTVAGSAAVGSSNADGLMATFNGPNQLTLNKLQTILYATDNDNHNIRAIELANNMAVSTLAGTALAGGSADATGASAQFYYPNGVAMDTNGNVLVVDGNNYTIRSVTPQGEASTLAGMAEQVGSVDGDGAQARFSTPSGVATDGAGNVYVADTGNYTIRKTTPKGVVTTLAGAAGQFGSTDHAIGTDARFNSPFGVATDAAGNVYVADTFNHTIRKITTDGDVSTLAGTPGASGPAVVGPVIGTASTFNIPYGLAVDAAGNVYVADTNNHAIRKIAFSNGMVTTLAGGGTPALSGSKDDSGNAARFNNPIAIAIGLNGNLYVADYGNHTIRMVTPGGVVTTPAGSAGQVGSANGDGAAARFNFPRGIATDANGNVYVSDLNNSTIRKITPAGKVSTVVGVAGVAGFTPGALPGQLNRPFGIAVRGSSLYVAMRNGVAVVTNVP